MIKREHNTEENRVHMDLIEEAQKTYNEDPKYYKWLEGTIRTEKLEFLKSPNINLIKGKLDESQSDEIYAIYKKEYKSRFSTKPKEELIQITGETQK